MERACERALCCCTILGAMNIRQKSRLKRESLVENENDKFDNLSGLGTQRFFWQLLQNS
eukprot:COSAG02_NODE_3524_length_6615_cov_6.371393_8_plen_59_part_00